MSVVRLFAIVLLLTAHLATPASAADPPTGEDALAAEPTPPPATRLALETFGGGQRLVVGSVTASMPESAPGIKILLVASVVCGRERIANTQNVARGTSATLTPRLLVPDAQRCSLWARSVGLGDSRGEDLVTSGALEAGPVVAGARGYEPAGQPLRLSPGQAAEVVPATWTVPLGTLALTVLGDVKTTACTAVRGSQENGSPNLCQGRVNFAGSSIRVSLLVGYPGSMCPAITVTRRDDLVDRVRHHAMTYQDAKYLLPALRGCGPTVRVSLVVEVLAGSDLVVHAGGTTTAVFTRPVLTVLS
jgi:hypothetical protein